MKKTYMLDTNICSFIMRERPEMLLKVLQGHVENKDRLVVSAITYAELRFGAIGKKASPKHPAPAKKAAAKAADKRRPPTPVKRISKRTARNAKVKYV